MATWAWCNNSALSLHQHRSVSPSENPPTGEAKNTTVSCCRVLFDGERDGLLTFHISISGKQKTIQDRYYERFM